MKELSKVRINGEDYALKDETARSNSVGYSTYYVDLPLESLDPTYVSSNKISNSGAGIKIGDIVIFSNGTLCEVTEVTYRDDGSSVVLCVPKSNIGSNGSGGYVAYDEAQELTDEQKTQARDNIGAQPKGNYLTQDDKQEIAEMAAELVDIPTQDPDGGVEEGFSPTATVTQTDSGAVISITDKDGTTTAIITNGKDYVLTDADKEEIAEQAAELVEVPDVGCTPEMFGAVGDGDKDDTEAIRSCINYANEKGLEVKFAKGKIYRVNQETSIVAHCSIDFNGSTIILSGGSTNPFIKIEPLTKNTYTLTESSLTEYAVTDKRLFNKCMTIVSPISLGIRGGGTTGGNRPFTQTIKTDMNGNFINGKLECEITPGSYTIKSVHDYLNQTLEIKNVTVDYSKIPDNDTAIFINSYRSNVKFDNINIVEYINIDDWSHAVLGISNSCNIEISNIRGNSPYSKGGSGYIVGLYETADVYMHDCDFGGSTTQWGCIGVDYISNFVAERVNTNRFDCHYYFTGYFTVRDCTTNLALFCGGNGEMSYERVNFIRTAAGYTVERREDLVIMPSGIVKFSECTFDGGGAFKWKCPTPDADLLTNIKYEFTHFVFENCKIHTPYKIFAIFDMESGWNNVLVDIINTNVGKRSLESWGASKVKRAIIRGCTFSQRIEVQGCDELIITECSGDTVWAVKDKVESCVLYGNILTPTVDTLIQSNSAIIANNMILADQPLTLKSGLKYIVANNLPLYDTYKSSWENKNN